LFTFWRALSSIQIKEFSAHHYWREFKEQKGAFNRVYMRRLQHEYADLSKVRVYSFAWTLRLLSACLCCLRIACVWCVLLRSYVLRPVHRRPPYVSSVYLRLGSSRRRCSRFCRPVPAQSLPIFPDSSVFMRIQEGNMSMAQVLYCTVSFIARPLSLTKLAVPNLSLSAALGRRDACANIRCLLESHLLATGVVSPSHSHPV
jgi:hypothetical protein